MTRRYSCSLLIVFSAYGQVPFYATPGQVIRGDMLGSAIHALTSFATTASEEKERMRGLEQELRAARRAYWIAQGPAREAAGPRYSEALFLKDVHFIAQALLELQSEEVVKLYRAWTGQEKGPSMDLLTYFRVVTGATALDGGIIPFARAEFDTTTKAFKREVLRLNEERKAGRSPNIPYWPELVPREYLDYLNARLLGDYLFSDPRGALRQLNPDPEDYLVAWILGVKGRPTKEDAITAVADFKRTGGMAALREVAQTVQRESDVALGITGPFQPGQAMRWLNEVVVRAQGKLHP